MKTASPVLILAPMESEYSYLFNAVEGKMAKKIGSHTFYTGEYAGVPVVIVKTLIGMVNSATATVEGILAFSPRAVIIQGTSGAHDKRLRRGDIVLSNGVLDMGNFHTPHKEVGETAEIEEYSFCGSESEKEGESVFSPVLKTDETLLKLAKKVEWDAPVYVGVIASGDQWNRELGKISYMHETFGTLCEEMEGYAVTHAANAYNVPVLDVRVVSNNEWIEEETFDESVAPLSQRYVLELVKLLKEEPVCKE